MYMRNRQINNSFQLLNAEDTDLYKFLFCVMMKQNISTTLSSSFAITKTVRIKYGCKTQRYYISIKDIILIISLMYIVVFHKLYN